MTGGVTLRGCKVSTAFDSSRDCWVLRVSKLRLEPLAESVLGEHVLEVVVDEKVARGFEELLNLTKGR